MELALQKHLGSARRVALVGLGVLGCCLLSNLTLADVSSAAEPPAGSKACQESGKINGRGSTYQKVLLWNYAELYKQDFCGAVGAGTEGPVTLKGEAGNSMVAYDYPAAEAAGLTGSGNGNKGSSCRSDAFTGTDNPYTHKELEELGEKPGKLGGCSAITFTTPFPPSGELTGEKYPEKEDTTAPIMSFPVGGSSVSLPINLSAGECGGTAPSGLTFNQEQVSKIFGGEVAKWNEAVLTVNNPSLASCNVAITRVVRADSSGTTVIFKNYLIRLSPLRTGETCGAAKEWQKYYSKNQEWPGLNRGTGTKGNEVAKWEENEAPTNCKSSIIFAGESTEKPKSGGTELRELVKSTPGAIGYLDTPEAIGQGLIIPDVLSATGGAGSYQPPNVSQGANCNYTVGSLPGAGPNESVGLDPEDNWANNNEEASKGVYPNHGNVAGLGSKYPICGLTFDLVYTGLDAAEKTPNPIYGLTNNQRRTLYSFFTFVLSSTAQAKLTSLYYAPLPTSWTGKLTEGFQANF
jgi:ABC-type phosphate transport system substrate-binding protein